MTAGRKPAARGLEVPGPTWCSWHQATFRFFPQAAVTPEEVRAGLRRRIVTVIGQRNLEAEIEEQDDRRVGFRIIRADRSRTDWKFILDGDRGEFWLEGDPDDMLGLIAEMPHEFLEALTSPLPDIKWLPSKRAKAIAEIARQLQLLGERQLSLAIRSGAAKIVARPATIFAPFTTIPLDIWQGFEVKVRDVDVLEEDRIWDAVGIDDSKMFSVHVAPGEGPIQYTPGPSLSRAERGCRDWLVQLRQESSELPPATREALKAEALGQFRGLSGAAFNRAWSEAKARVPCPGWERPGRPSRASGKPPRSKTLYPEKG